MSANAGDGAASAGTPNPGGSKRLAQQQAQVDEVVEIMRQNVDKVLERDKNLSQLDDRADKLQHNAAQFEQQAGKLKRKFWLQNMKMMIIMGIIGAIFALVVGSWAYSKYKALAPALPSVDIGGGASATPSIKEETLKITAAPTTTPPTEKTTTKRPKRRRKKTTVPANLTGLTVPSATDDDDDGPNNTQDASKTVLKRIIRALIK